MATTAKQNYAEYSLTELYEALSSIQHEAYPEAFSALVAEIDTRTFSSMTELEDCYFKLDKEKWPEYGQRLWEQIRSGGNFAVLASELVVEDDIILEDIKYRNVWRRIFAAFIDWLILIVLSTVMGVVVTSKLSALPWLLPFVEVAMQYLWIAYFIFLHGLYGQSIGKMITGVKLIDKSEEKPITYWQATLREIAPISASIIFSVYVLVAGGINVTAELTLTQREISVVYSMLGLAVAWNLASFVTMLLNKKRRTIHDFIAGTIVVRSKWSDLQESLGEKQAKHRDD